MTPARRQLRIEDYRKRLAKEPDARVFAPLADLLRQEGRLDEALKILERGLAVHPTYVTGRVVQGKTLLAAGRTDAAREVLRGVLADDRENLVVLRLLAEEALSRGDAGGARPLLESLVVLDPEPAPWRAALRGIETGAEEAPGTPESGEAPRDDPFFATMTLVDIYLAQGYRDKARAVLERILEQDPEREDAASRLAGLADPPRPGGSSSLLAGVRPEPADPVERTRVRTERRRRDKRSFEEWVSRLRDDGGSPS